jgi:ankyrin repeat protein
MLFSAQIDALNSEGTTPLHLALKNGNNNVVSVLLERGANYLIPDSKVSKTNKHEGKNPTKNIVKNS